MLGANGTISISINIGKHDNDIASWFNLLTRTTQSRSMWASALLLAYSQGNYLETGCVLSASASSPPPASVVHQSPPNQALLFGTGNSLQKKKGRNYGWTVKGSHGEFIVGSVITLRLTNRQIIQIYWKLRADDIPVSVLLKELIRKGLRYGDIEAAPNPLHAKKVLASYCDSHYTLNLSPFLINSDPVDTKTPFIAASPPSADVEQQAEKISRNPLLDFI